MRTPWFLGNSREWGYSQWHMAGFFLPLMIWSVVWTGLALWHAAKRGEKWWFILFLFVHTAGILEIVYLIFVAHAFATSKPHSKKRRHS